MKALSLTKKQKEQILLRAIARASIKVLDDLKIGWGPHYPASETVWRLDRLIEELLKVTGKR